MKPGSAASPSYLFPIKAGWITVFVNSRHSTAPSPTSLSIRLCNEVSELVNEVRVGVRWTRVLVPMIPARCVHSVAYKNMVIFFQPCPRSCEGEGHSADDKRQYRVTDRLTLKERVWKNGECMVKEYG